MFFSGVCFLYPTLAPAFKREEQPPLWRQNALNNLQRDTAFGACGKTAALACVTT